MYYDCNSFTITEVLEGTMTFNVAGSGKPGSNCSVEVCFVEDGLNAWYIRSQDTCQIPDGEYTIASNTLRVHSLWK